MSIANAIITPTQRAYLQVLQGKHVYGGTVPDHVVKRRRAANKVARRSRRINRSS